MNNIRTGKVLSAHMQKTIIVSVMHPYTHPLYKKTVKRHKKFSVHNEHPDIAVGDMVRIRETKPISGRTHYVVVEKVR